jgi:hypothetical protein
LRAPLAAALVLAWPATAAEPVPAPAPPTPDPELLEFIGASAGIDAELALFMESREARKAIEDAVKEDRKEDRKEGP